MMRALLILTAAMLASVGHAQTVAAPKAWATCAACHGADGRGGIGPALTGVVGRKAGSVAGFGYSRAMKNAGMTWDDAVLAAFITDPQAAVPGNRMPFTGVQDPSEVAELLVFLKTLR